MQTRLTIRSTMFYCNAMRTAMSQLGMIYQLLPFAAKLIDLHRRARNAMVAQALRLTTVSSHNCNIRPSKATDRVSFSWRSALIVAHGLAGEESRTHGKHYWCYPRHKNRPRVLTLSSRGLTREVLITVGHGRDYLQTSVRR